MWLPVDVSARIHYSYSTPCLLPHPPKSTGNTIWPVIYANWMIPVTFRHFSNAAVSSSVYPFQ